MPLKDAESLALMLLFTLVGATVVLIFFLVNSLGSKNRKRSGPSTLYYSQKMERDYPALPAGVPAGLRELVDRCLMFDPAKRPPDAAGLLRILARGG